MFRACESEGPNLAYLEFESVVLEETRKRIKDLVSAPCDEIAQTINEVLEHAKRTDEKLRELSQGHPYYRIMAERFVSTMDSVFYLKMNLPKFESGDRRPTIEAAAKIAVINGICHMIDYVVDDNILDREFSEDFMRRYA